MKDLSTTLMCMAYGAGLWLVLVTLVAALWFGLAKWDERKQAAKWSRAWNEWMEFHK